MEEEEDTCPTKLLPDSPVKEDSFGSHEKVADSIANLISEEGKEENGGKTLAITGDWGSGKSSVIEILKENLGNKTNDVKVFTYNAWSHQGDPLRRSFLEKLIDFFIDQDWISKRNRKKYWEKEKKKLSKKIKEKKVEKTPFLTPIGKIFAILTLLVPVGASVTANLLTSQSSYQLWQLIGSSSLAIGPVAFVILLYILAKFDLIKEDFRFLSQQSSEFINSKTLESPNPTSIEFQDTFSDLMDDVIVGSNRQLVIVMDNIDRIDPEEALEVWSTMRTFLDFPDTEEWVDNLWVLVPFDEKAIKKAWEEGIGEENSNANRDNEPSHPFLDKTFQTRFHVPKPLLSNWKKFFVEKMSKALPEHESEEFESAYKIYSVLRENKTRAPTPREIKLYINEVGAIHRQWCPSEHDIPLEDMALYASLQDMGWNPEEDLTDPDKLFSKHGHGKNSNLESLLSKDWQKNLAAFHLNKAPDKSMEIFLRPKIANVARERDKERLEELRKVPGFADSLVQLLEQNALENASGIPILAHLLGETKEKGERTWRDVWNQLLRNSLEVDQWDVIDQKVGNGLLNIAEYIEYREKLGEKISKLANSLSHFGTTQVNQNHKDEIEISDDNIKSWFEGTVPLLRFVVEREGLVESVSKEFSVPGNFDVFAEICSLVINGNDVGKDAYPLFQSEKKPQTIIIEELAIRCKQNEYYDKCLSVVRIMRKHDKTYQWENLIDQIKSTFNDQNKNFDSEECSSIIGTLFELEDTEVDGRKGKTLLENLSSNGQFAHHLNRSLKEDSPGAGSLISAILLHQPNLNNISNWTNRSGQGVNFINNTVFDDLDDHTAIVEEYVRLLSRYATFEKHLDVAQEGNEKFFGYVLDFVVDSDEFCLDEIISEENDVKTFYEKFKIIEANLSEKTLPKIVTELDRKKRISSVVQKQDFVPEKAKLYSILIQKNHNEEFVDYIKSGLNGVDSETDRVDFRV